jgi:choline dehydrogenase-like flavoprotein
MGKASAPAADVLIVGAGASGAVAARHLAAGGFRVVCLEQGDWVSTSDYPGDRLEYELLAGSSWHLNPNVRRRPEDYPCEVSDAEIWPLMHNAVGGSTIHFAGHWMRMLPSDFRARTLDGVADDWPLTYDDLVPYYARIDAEMGVSGLGGDPAYPPGPPPPLPALPIGKAGRVAALGMNRLGWHWWPGRNAMPSQAYGRQQACARRGTCMWGCNEGAKASTDITHWPDAIRDGAQLLIRCRVREITVNGRGLATGAVYIDPDGVERFQPASVVMLAANGVGTARLLLLSASKRFPDGLANGSGLVGRRLMMHPFVSVLGIYAEHLDSWQGPAGQLIYSLQFYESDAARGFRRGAIWKVMPAGSPLGSLMRFAERPFDQRFGPAIHDVIDRAVGRSFDWGISAEDLPLPDNRVTLDPALTDGSGIPAPKITYSLPDETQRLLDFHVARAREAHGAAGAVETIVSHWMPDAGAHLIGTARMGTDRETSVVDPYGRSHDVPNLYIVDGSIFVCAGSVNPTATICALALRNAEHLMATARLQAVPA